MYYTLEVTPKVMLALKGQEETIFVGGQGRKDTVWVLAQRSLTACFEQDFLNVVDTVLNITPILHHEEESLPWVEDVIEVVKIILVEKYKQRVHTSLSDGS